MSPIASVVVPAHNEARVVVANLAGLLSGFAPDELDVVVVCNGCTDDTAVLLRRSGLRVRVLEIPEASKRQAVDVGNRATDVFPRVHLDADVRLSAGDLRALVRPIVEDGVLATAPRRELPRDQSSWVVRWYYDVWEQLPQVRSGLFGRGAIALSEEGQRRVSAMPALMSDDLGASEAFSEAERRVVPEAVARVLPPRTARDLLRRRVRVATGNAQASRLGVRRPASVTSVRSLGGMLARRPGLASRVPVFVGMAVVARIGAWPAVRTGDFATWLRDESSRA